MIYYLVTGAHGYTLGQFLSGRGQSLAARIQLVSYDEFLAVRAAPIGTYIFSDIERLEKRQAMRLQVRWRRLQSAGARLLNHPLRSLRRYELLRKLHEEGINDFNVYMAAEHRHPQRFPVFVRAAKGHHGSMTRLLPDQVALDATLAGLRTKGVWLADKLIAEYVDTAGADGIYRKYAAFRIGDRLIPRQILAASQWVVKKPEFDTPALAAEEAAYIAADPHAGRLMQVFDIAGIEYGRVDYGVVGGKAQIFEINTNPNIIGVMSLASEHRAATYSEVVDRIITAIEAIDDVTATGGVAMPN